MKILNNDTVYYFLVPNFVPHFLNNICAWLSAALFLFVWIVKKSGFVRLSLPPARNVKCPSDMKRTSCVKCAFGTIAEHLTSLAAKRQTSL